MPKIPAAELERTITSQVVSFLEQRGWRPIRFQRTVDVKRGFQTGEPGQADYLFLKYDHPEYYLVYAMWIEFKSPRDRRSCGCLTRAKAGKRGICGFCQQANWRSREIARGAVVLIVSNFDDFMRGYDSLVLL